MRFRPQKAWKRLKAQVKVRGNPRIALGRCLGPGESRVIHIRFPMTQRTHNLRLMVDPSDHLRPPDNPPFGQTAKLHGWLSLKNGHIYESNERNNAKWVCIKVFRLKPGEVTSIPIPVINPYPGVPTGVVIEMDEKLVVPEPLELGVPAAHVTQAAIVNNEPFIEPVEPGQVISEFEFDPASDEEVVVMAARLLDNIVFEQPVRFKVLGTPTDADGQPILAEVTVVLVTDTQPEVDVLTVEEVSSD